CANGGIRVRRTSSSRAACDRRKDSQTDGTSRRIADRPGGPDRPAGERGLDEPRNRHPPVSQCAHRRVAPPQRLRQGRDRTTRRFSDLVQMEVSAFAERARRELLATGEKTRRRTAPADGSLTAQEAQIVRLVKEGLTNPEIGTRLFLSARTVEWHLRNVFGKV